MSQQVIINRSDVVAFAAISETTTSGGTTTTTTTNYRMTKFSKFSPSKNAKEYNRQYVDEIAETSDVVGYAPSIDYSLDAHRNNPVHAHFRKVTDDECIGDAATVDIISVDVTDGDAYKRTWAIVPGAEGDSLNAYTYAGTLKAKGEAVHGTATSSDNWQTCTFTEDT